MSVPTRTVMRPTACTPDDVRAVFVCDDGYEDAAIIDRDGWFRAFRCVDDVADDEDALVGAFMWYREALAALEAEGYVIGEDLR